MTPFENIQYNATIICGNHKSGTTLLLALLDNHPQLTVLPEELNFFIKVYNKKNPAKRLLTKSGLKLFKFDNVNMGSPDVRFYSDIDFQYIETEVTLLCERTQSFRKMLLGAMRIWHEVQASQTDEKMRWVEKSPWNEKYVYIYQRWFKENAIYLHIIRDPRDNFATLKKKRPQLTLKEFSVNWGFLCGIALWARKAIPHYYCIRYEDLVREPVQELQKICSLLRIRFADSLLLPTRNGKPWQGNSLYGTKFHAISPRSVGRYKEQLRDEEIQYLEEALHKYMLEFDYELEHKGIQKLQHEVPKMIETKISRWHLQYRHPYMYAILKPFQRLGIKI